MILTISLQRTNQNRRGLISGGSLFPTKCALFLFCGLFPDDCFFQGVTCLETNSLACWNLNLGFRRWVCSCPGGCLPHFKRAENRPPYHYQTPHQIQDSTF